jgi:hypothetical protein
MKDFLIEEQGNKFVITDKKMQYTKSNLQYLQQKVRCVVSLFLGEWFLDKTLGIPYIPTTDNKIEHQPLIETALHTKITGIKGIKKLIRFDPVFNRSMRTLTVTFTAQTDSGETFDDQIDFGGPK